MKRLRCRIFEHAQNRYHVGQKDVGQDVVEVIGDGDGDVSMEDGEEAPSRTL